MHRSFPFNLYRGSLSVVPEGWEPGTITEECYKRGFDASEGEVTFFVPDADDTLLIHLIIAEKHELPSVTVLRAIRLPFEAKDATILSNIDIEDDMPIPELVQGRYSVQFEISPGLVVDDVAYAYDIRLTFVRDDCTTPMILVSGHREMTAPVGPVEV